MKKKIIKILLVVVLVILLLYGLLHIAPVRGQVLKYVLQRMEAATGAKVHAESLDYNLLKWRFTLKKVSVFKKNMKNINMGTGQVRGQLPAFFKAEQIIIDIPFPLSWKKSIHLEQVSVIDPAIYYFLSAQGEDNLPFQAPGEAGEAGESGTGIPAFLIEHLDITNARVVIQDQVSNWHLEIPGIDTTLRWLEQETHSLSLDIRDKGTWQIGPDSFSVDGLSLRAILDAQDIRLKQCKVQVGRNNIEILGMIKNYASPAAGLDITVMSNFFPEDAGTLLPQLQDIPGGISIRAHLQGSLPDPEIKVHLKARDLMLSQPIATSAAGTAEVFLKGFSPDHLKAKGNLQLSPLAEVPGKPIKKGIPLQGSLSFEIQPDKINLELRKLKTAGITIDGQLLKNVDEIKGNLLVVVPDIKKSLRRVQGVPVGAEYTPWAGAVLETGIEGSGMISAKIGGSMEAPQVTAKINSRFQVKDSEPITLEGLLTYTGEIFRVDTLDIRQDQGNLHISGIIPIMSNAPSKQKANNLQLTLRGENIDTASIMPLLNIDLPFRGVVSLITAVEINPQENKLKTAVEHLEIKSGSQVIKNQEPFHLALHPEFLSIENLQISMDHDDVEPGETNKKLLRGVQGGSFLEKSPPGKIHINGDLLFSDIRNHSHRPLTINAEVDCRLLHLFYPPLEAEGNIKLHGEITGSLAQPTITGELDLSGGKALLKDFPGPVENIDLHMKTSGEKIIIDSIGFEWQGGQFSLTGSLPFSTLFSSPRPDAPVDGEAGFSLALRLRNVSTKMMQSTLPQEWADKISGSLDADFEIHGRHPSLDQLSGSGRIYNVQLDVEGFKFQQPEPIILSLEKQTLTLEKFLLSDPDSFLRGKGTLQLKEEYPLQAEWEGQVDSRVLNGFWEDITFSGTNKLYLLVKGTINNPEFSGAITPVNLGMQHLFHHLYISGLNGKISIEKDRIYTQEPIKGSLNGGELQIMGSGTRWEFHIKGAEMDIPWGLLSNASGTMVLQALPNGKGYLLSGSIPVSNGFYKEPFGLNSRLYRYLRQMAAQAAVQPIEQDQVPLEFNINIFTETPIQVENNMAKAEISANLKLSGSYTSPVLAGRAEIKEGGEIYLGKNTFYIERGLVNFINPYLVEPELDISARTQAADTDIRLNITGTPRALSAVFSSTPPLPESHIIALLVSGKPMESTSPTTLSKVGHQTLTYLGSTVAGKVENAVKQTLGLETVRIDGSLVAAKENPGARLTLGHHLASNLEVIMSQSLRQSQDRTWIVNYNPLANINLQAARQDNNAYNLGINHEMHFGLKPAVKTPAKSGAKAKKSPGQQKIAEIVITGEPRLPEKEIRKRLSLKKGKPFHFFQVQRDRGNLLELYHKKNYLNADITAKKEETGNKVKVLLEIDAGPRVFLEFPGPGIPGHLKKKARKTWISNHFEEQRFSSILRQFRVYFFKKKYYKAAVEVETAAVSQEQQRVIFHINRGPRYKSLQIRFKGNRYRSGPKLTKLLQRSELVPFTLIQPAKVTRFLEQWYRQEGFLSAVISPPQVQWLEDKDSVNVTLDINEGPRSRIGKIQFSGSHFLDNTALEKSIRLKEGDFYSSQKSILAAASVESTYAREGFYNTRVTVKPYISKAANRVDLDFIITESPRLRIKDIRIQGNQITREKTIKRELLFKTGDILDLKALNETRKNLYDMGIFQRVNLEVLTEGETGTGNQERECIIEVRVNERKPYQLRYGIQVDTETSVGISGQLIDGNLFGKASLLGTSLRYNKKEQDARIFSRFPGFPGKKISTELFLFFNRKEEPSFVVPIRRTGITLQQQWRIARKSLLSFSYTFENYRGETAVNLGHITASYTYDTRDSFWNASRGLFFSHSIQYAGKFLGSRLEYSRYLGQFSLYRTLSARLVSATSVHVGLGDALGQALLPGERFFAGGSTTIRGFKHNSVGPINPQTLKPEGGEALFIFKQEIRLRLFPAVSTVFFLDMGNVYPFIADFNIFDIRKAVGIGLRFNFYGLLLRVDWGFKLDRRQGESLSRIYFSIGQSF